jgi:hypothetical protein
VEPALPQVGHDSLANNAQTEHSNIFSRPTRHLPKSIRGDCPAFYRVTAENHGKPTGTQCEIQASVI